MDYKDFWLSILRRLEPTIARGKFLTWFQNTAALGLTSGRLTLGTPTTFAQNWLQTKYALKILQAAQELDTSVVEVEFIVDATLADGHDPRTVNLNAVFAKEGDKKIRRVAGTHEVTVTTGGIRSGLLNPRYTLANFVPGEENRLAHAAALAVSRLPGQTYNPLVIYGGVGLGKTHLLSAIGHEVLTNDPSKVVVYLTAEMFMNEYVAACRRGKTDDFRRRYRDADVFLLDDVQFLEGGEQTQIEFFNVFNAVHGAGKQMVVTSDRPPHQLSGIMDRLRSRLNWGLVAEVEQPSYKSRVEILKLKARERRALVDPAVINYLAEHVTDSVRTLEGALTSTLAESDLLHLPPTLATVTRLVERFKKTLFAKTVDTLPIATPSLAATPDAVIAAVAAQFSLSADVLATPSRKKELMLARAVAMFLLREMFGMSLESVGNRFNRDHATALHAIEKIKTSLATDEQLIARVGAIRQTLAA